MSQRPSVPVSRRHALGGAAGLGLGLPLLAACGGDGSTATDPAPASPAASPGEVLTSTGDVPVGSGVILADAEVVVTQPTEGEFKAWTNVCTHQGCALESISPEGIRCPCHGSVFDVATGEPTAGPASSSLTEVLLNVDGDEITLA
ncbi:Cytochrome b6-f complex iron-sulfur subunit 1 [Nocardioides dokdonensis FR1436]|uniref:Cytochrome bc1 complex Rieske iron-sulfur subunit n=1 Tax=Nocardioides dokdonensis FR1436 TaxID=1300347 RepID=A0A1A9GNH7_9ACTN|nr:Rieske (2Fe-2S) protein [Nocardioides dokdonensis]ANH39844.1 Cytochrome b6-f complex iron-sulfur subunit 1 [Nocardioides dokdonensis FR1436]